MEKNHYVITIGNMADYWKHVLAKIHQQCTLASNGECLLWPASKCTAGYGQTSVRGLRERYVHRLVVMATLQTADIGGRRTHTNCSHLCHNSRCCKADHISLEPVLINNQRKNCLSEGKCSGHTLLGKCYPGCHVNLRIK